MYLHDWGGWCKAQNPKITKFWGENSNLVQTLLHVQYVET
jgi:hypothetical protein